MLLSQPSSRCAATAQSPCWGPIQPLGCNAQGHSAVTPPVTRDSNFGNQTPFAPRIRCPSPPSPSLHTSLRPLCALPGVPPSCPQPACPLPSCCPPLAALTPVPSTPQPARAAADASALCCVGVWVLGCWVAGGDGVSGVRGSGRAAAFLCWDLAGCSQCCGLGWETGPALGEGLVLPQFPLVLAGKGPGLALL